MSDIDTDEEPEDILDQLAPEEEEEAPPPERAEEEEIAPGKIPAADFPTPIEEDLERANLGAAFSYVVYYSAGNHQA